MASGEEKGLTNEILNSEIPYFAITKHVHIEMFSNRHIVIEGSFSVMEYSEDLICLKLKKGMLQLIGSGLTISTVMEDKIVIIGEVLSISFDR